MQTDWDAVAGLVDVTRRRLYDHLRSQAHPVSREEAAGALGISRSLAAFHLDKLVEIGLATAQHERAADVPRGRGRPPKVYEPTGTAVSVSVPERRYDMIAEILAEAVAEEPEHADAAAQRIARVTGRRMGADSSATAPGNVLAALEELGYRPDTDADGRVQLDNCPFRHVASRHPALVCALNRTFIAGLLEGLAATGVDARLVPRARGCCVELVSRS